MIIIHVNKLHPSNLKVEIEKQQQKYYIYIYNFLTTDHWYHLKGIIDHKNREKDPNWNWV